MWVEYTKDLLKMTEDLLTKEYLSRFPTLLREVLTEEQKQRDRFLRRVKENYQPVRVFRGIHNEEEIIDDDFICNIEESEKYGGSSYKRVQVEHYAISVNEDPKAIVKSLSIPNINHPWLMLGEGMMEQEHGPADFMGDATHHNWFLYEASIPLMKNKFVITDECRRIVKEAREEQAKPET